MVVKFVSGVLFLLCWDRCFMRRCMVWLESVSNMCHDCVFCEGLCQVCQGHVLHVGTDAL